MAIARSRFPFRAIHVGALALCAVFLPWSTAFLSMAQMLLAANWLAQGIAERRVGQRFKAALSSAPALVFISFFLLHVLGLLWTDDMAWGTDLGRILFPVLVLGIILPGSDRLLPQEMRIILRLGAWSAIACASFGLLYRDGAADDYRAISVFISHIRLALLLCLAVAILLINRPKRLGQFIAHCCGAALSVYLIARLGSIQGFAILAVLGLVLIWRHAQAWPAIARWGVRITILVLPIATVATVIGLIDSRHHPLPQGLGRHLERTAGGEPYYHDTLSTQTENGAHVWTYLAWGELRRAWALRSDRTLDDLDDKGHALWSTATRYIASKGWRKDSVSVMMLTDADVRAIESGRTNFLQGQRGPLRERLEEVLFELDQYRSSGEASGHSVAMRIEFQKAGWALARENWIHGVGTGDTQRAFDDHYARTRSTLGAEWRLRAHNEYLTLWISFGLPGLLWSLYSWWWPAYRMGAWRDPLFIAWAIAFGISCFTDDTIETQAGATFFALYYTLFVFAAPGAREPVSP